jgi:hypothetical protein
LGASALSLIARWWLLGKRPLWHDEIFTLWASRLSPSELLRALRFDSGPPLFYLLEKPLVRAAEAFALPDAAARLLPFLALAVLFAGARALPPCPSRGYFLLLAACSPFFLLYSVEARAYAVLAFAGFLLFLLVAADAVSWRRCAAIALVAAFALWTHYLALFLVGSLLLVALMQRRWRSALALAAGLVLFLPWSPVLLTQPRAATVWMKEPLRAAAAGFLAALGGGLRVLAPFGPLLPEPLLWLSCAVGATLLFLVLRRPHDAGDRLGLATLFLTFGGILAASLGRPVALAGRSEMAVLPIWLWLLARKANRSGAVRLGIAAASVIAAAASLLLLAAPRSPRPSYALIPRLESEARKGDLVVATATLYLPARLARDRGWLAAGLSAFPADLADHPGWFLQVNPSQDEEDRLLENVARAGVDHTVFLLFDRPFWTPRLQQSLSTRGSLRMVASLRTAFLAAFTARPSTPPPN